MMRFGLSTSWNATKHKDGYAIIDEIKAAGFDSVELNFTLTASMVEDIAAVVKKGGIEVKSLHNFCPIPEGLKQNQASPDYYSLASLDENERKKAIDFTRQTIAKAAELGAGAVVLHCGNVQEKDYTRRLIALLGKGEAASGEFKRLKDQMLHARAPKAGAHVAKLFKSLDALNAFACKKDIILGVENRFYYMEVPSIEEIGQILNEFKASSIYYWHDVGHAQVWDELDIISHKEILEELGSQIAGMHFHDVKGAKDHLAPGCGDFDFSILKPYIRDSVINIIEAHHPATADEIRHSKRYLSDIFTK